MTRILFVCLGNICRSPMAESVMTYLIKTRGLADITVSSAATSREELGNPPHPGTQRVLAAHGIPLIPHRARQMTVSDREGFDLLIGMDSSNLRNMARIVGQCEKLHRLSEWTGRNNDIADPWYTGDFESIFTDIWEGCNALLDALL